MRACTRIFEMCQQRIEWRSWPCLLLLCLRTAVLMCLVTAVLLRSVRSALINLHMMTFQNLQHVTLSLTLRLRQISLWRQVHAVMSCIPNAGITSSEHTALEIRTHVSRHFFRFSLSIPLHFLVLFSISEVSTARFLESIGLINIGTLPGRNVYRLFNYCRKLE